MTLTISGHRIYNIKQFFGVARNKSVSGFRPNYFQFWLDIMCKEDDNEEEVLFLTVKGCLFKFDIAKDEVVWDMPRIRFAIRVMDGLHQHIYENVLADLKNSKFYGDLVESIKAYKENLESGIAITGEVEQKYTLHTKANRRAIKDGVISERKLK